MSLAVGSVDYYGLVHRTVLEAASTTAKEAQFRIRPEATVFDPLAKEFILARDPNPAEFLIAFSSDPISQLWHILPHERMSIALAAQCVVLSRLSSVLARAC